METPLLVLTDFGVSYGRRVVLDRVDLSLPAQGLTVLMGPVKAGKSTLMNTLAGRYAGHPLHRCWGDVRYAGSPLGENSPQLVSQHLRSPDLRVMDALLKPLRDSGTLTGSPVEWRDRGLHWLSQRGLAACVDQAQAPLMALPPHLRRAVLILSQYLLDAPLLMIDEPTYGLDEREALWLIDWLRQLQGTSRLWVTLHNQIQARHLADHIILLGGGRIVAQQPRQAFFQSPANVWVGQFIRSGSLALPAADAKPEDLDDTGGWPLLGLSDAARAMIATFAPNAPPPQAIPVTPATATAAGTQPIETISSDTLTPEPVAQATQPPAVPIDVLPGANNGEQQQPPAPASPKPSAAVTVEPPACSALKPALDAAAARRPVTLPVPGAQGVEMAAMVGGTILRDHSAPRSFHWIVPGKLAGCAAPGVVNAIDYDLAVLDRMGITYLITLTETNLDQDALRRFGLKNLHLPIFDREAPSNAQTHMLLVRMERLMTQGEVLAVHCKAGLGRTGTILAAWMIRDGGFTAAEAIRRLRLIEPGFIQSQDQEQFLFNYEHDLTLRLL